MLNQEWKLRTFDKKSFVAQEQDMGSSVLSSVRCDQSRLLRIAGLSMLGIAPVAGVRKIAVTGFPSFLLEHLRLS